MATEPQRIYLNTLYDQELDATPKSELSLLVDHADFDVPRRILFDFESTAQTDVILGSQLLSSTGWTSTGWTGDYSTGFTHTPSNTSALSNTIAAIIDKIYQITLTVTGRTAGSFTVAFGGDTSTAFTSTEVFGVTASTNANLVITPTTDFDGTIVVSIKQVTWELTEAEVLAILGVADVVSSAILSAGYVALEAGKGLILATEVTRLAKSPTTYSINLPAAANLAAKIAAAVEGTDYPTGWVLAATDTVNLTITHGLAKEIDHATVKKVVGSSNTILKPYSTAYSQIIETATSLATPVNAAFTPGAGTLADGSYYYRVSAINAIGQTLASTETSLAIARLATPVNAAFTPGAGTLAIGTYYYRVSAINAIGETLASTETSLALGAIGGVNVNWGAVSGAAGYKVYGRSTGAELLIATVGVVTTYLDNGSITPSGALPASNTTAGGVNVNWGAVSGAAGYKVYGRSTGAELLIATVGVVTTYLDNGSITPSGALPASNTTTGYNILVIEGVDPTATQTLIHLTFLP